MRLSPNWRARWSHLTWLRLEEEQRKGRAKLNLFTQADGCYFPPFNTTGLCAFGFELGTADLCHQPKMTTEKALGWTTGRDARQGHAAMMVAVAPDALPEISCDGLSIVSRDVPFSNQHITGDNALGHGRVSCSFQKTPELRGVLALNGLAFVRYDLTETSKRKYWNNLTGLQMTRLSGGFYRPSWIHPGDSLISGCNLKG